MGQLAYGTITITDTNDIESIIVEYARNQNPGSAPESGWSTDRPAWAQGYYIWQRTRTHKAGTETSEDTYGTAVCITGSTGATGAAGRSLSSTVTHYTIATSSAIIDQSNMGSYTWTTNVPSYNASYPTYWVRVTNTYSNPSSTEYIFYKDQGITDAIKTSHDANTTAGQAKTAADAASQIANQTQTNLNNYINSNDANITALQSRLKRIWINENTSGDYVAGTYAASGINGITFSESNPQTYGYNTLLRHNMLALRYNTINMTALTTNALTFYVPTQNENEQWIQGKKGLELTSDGLSLYNPTTSSQNDLKALELTSSSLKFYASDGTTAQAEFGGTQARVEGQLIAQSGYIGTNETNRWFIGNRKNYDQTNSAALLSYGNAYIQLGEDGCWRLSTNRLHTGWNAASGSNVLHYPKWNNIYWDFGIHAPTQNANKFIYIRNYDSTDSGLTEAQILADLQDNFESNVSVIDSWQYRFYVTAEGSLYAKNIYVLDDNGNATQIGGTDGVYLLKSGGTITGNLEVNGTLTKGGKNIAYLTATPTNGQILVADGTAGGIKTSGYTIATSVPQNAIFTDKNVQTNLNNTTKFYLAGPTTTATNTGTLIFDSNVYVDTTAGALHATTFNGYTLAAAAAKGVDTSMTSTSTSTNLPTTKAVADLIATYLPLTGGTVSGAVDINDELYADSATFGNLIVNGVGRFTNGIYGDLIGNVTGSITGNAATADKVNHNLVIKLASGTTEGTNMFTFNGSAAKTVDITKSALGLGNVENKSSATIRGELTSTNVTTALGFTPYNSTNPNGYTTNTGTVTSVAASGSGGITISGSPITTSGTITVGLNLSTAINGLGEGTSNANREDYVVVQYAGGGTTTTTYHRRKLKLLFAALNSSDITTALGYTPYNSTNPNGYTSNVGTITGVTAGTGLNGGGTSGTVTLNHSNSVTAQTTQGIYPIKIDAQGHISAYGSAPTTLSGYGITDAKIANGVITLGSNTITPLTSQWTANLYVGKTATDKANAAATNGNVYLNLVENSTVRNAHKITGSGSSSVTSDANGNITINSPVSLTGVGFSDGTITFNKSDGTTVPITTSDFVITQATGATSLVRLKAGSTEEYEGYSAGTTTTPVYFNSSGQPAAVTSIAYSLLPIGTSASTVAIGNHSHGNITNSGDITADAPTIANGDQIVINDHSASKITNGPTFDGSTTTQFLTKAGTWGTPVGTTYSAGTGLSLSSNQFSIKLGYTTSGNNRAVQADTNGNLYVVQKDDNTNTTYTLTNALSSHKFTWTFTAGGSGSGSTTTALELVQGSNITLTDDATNKKITIAAKDTTYSAGNGLRLDGTQFINTRIPFVVGTQTAATGSWTGVCNDITALYDGLTIAYWLPYGGSGNATLNLTINGTETGAKNCYYGGTSRLSTHFGAGNIIYLTYRNSGNINGTNYEGWWANANYNSDYTIGYSWTSAATAAKSIAATYFYGSSSKQWFPISLIYGNTYAGAITFNINGQGAKPVYINGVASSSSNYSLPAGYYLVYWDGTNFYVRTDGKITGDITGTASSNVTSVQYDSTNAKFTYTKNGTNTDIVTIANLKTYLGLGAAAYKGVTDNSTATAVTSTDTNLITARTLYNAGYTKNTGTITGVTAGSGLSGGGTSGAVTLNHSNSVTAKTAAAQAAKTLTWGGTFTLYEEKYDAQGHITGVASYNMTMPANPNTDTKNTAGSTSNTNELFIIGATSQAANPQTYSNTHVRIRSNASNAHLVANGLEMITDDMNDTTAATKATMAYDSTLEAIVFSFA